MCCSLEFKHEIRMVKILCVFAFCMIWCLIFEFGQWEIWVIFSEKNEAWELYYTALLKELALWKHVLFFYQAYSSEM